MKQDIIKGLDGSQTLGGGVDKVRTKTSQCGDEKMADCVDPDFPPGLSLSMCLPVCNRVNLVQAMFLLQALLGSLCLAEQCSWQLQVLETETFQVVSNTLWRQQQVYGIQKIMKLLVEQAVDPQENEVVASEYVARQAFLTGMSPNVTMIAKEPVNPASGIHMSLELTLGAAALRDDNGKVEIVQLVRDGKGPCDLIRREALDSCEVLWATQDFDFRVTDIVLVKRSPKGNSPPDFFLVYLDDVLENFAPLPGLKDDLQRPVVLSGLILSPLSQQDTIQYKYSCPFSRILYQSTPSQESYSRIMYYHAEPPVSLAQSGFHSFNSIVVYQGLAYHLMRLHTDYSMRDFYRYLAGHRMYNKEIYVDMDSYGKDSVAILESEVPSAIYLDKGGSYDFALQLQVTGDFEQEDAEVTMLKLFELGISATVSKQSAVIINMTTTVNVGSRSMTYKVKSKVATMDKLRMTRKRKIRISDGGINTEHAGPGNSLIQTMLVLRNQISVPLYVGCRPDHRLVFDFERTVQYMEENKKKHRDCPIVTPLKPCFYFKDDFWPFFIVQDTVLSRSDPYLGRGFDNTSYCEHTLHFVLYLHGIPISENFLFSVANGRRDKVSPCQKIWQKVQFQSVVRDWEVQAQVQVASAQQSLGYRGVHSPSVSWGGH
ncbi:CTSRG protein, partial [Polypterus senegalus]